MMTHARRVNRLLAEQARLLDTLAQVQGALLRVMDLVPAEVAGELRTAETLIDKALQGRKRGTLTEYATVKEYRCGCTLAGRLRGGGCVICDPSVALEQEKATSDGLRKLAAEQSQKIAELRAHQETLEHIRAVLSKGPPV